MTYPYVDINDASPLTPSHFLCGHRFLTLPDTIVSVKESDPDYTMIPTDVSNKRANEESRKVSRDSDTGLLGKMVKGISDAENCVNIKHTKRKHQTRQQLR